MTKNIQAVYRNGVFRPLKPIGGIRENTELEITIFVKKVRTNPFLKFAGSLSEEEANSMIQVVEEEFEKVNPNEW